MSFEILREKKPSYSTFAMLLITGLALLLLAMALAFAYLLVSGGGSDYEMGTLLAFEFLVVGVILIVYARSFAAFREVAEDREERLLW